MRVLRIPGGAALRTMVAAMAALAGCHNSCNDIPPGAIPQPSGTYVCGWVHATADRADRDAFVIYQYEWSAEKTVLTPGGREHLDCLAARLAQSTCPIIIETSLDDRLDAARRAAVLTALAGRNMPLCADRVVVGRSDAEGLYGQEAPGVASGILSTRGAGNSAGAAQGGGMGGVQGGASGSTSTTTSSGGGMGIN